MSKYFKFPSTPYVFAAHKRVDKVLTDDEAEDFVAQVIIVEEKVDGSNLGLSFSNDGEFLAQNRGSYLYPPYGVQWGPLKCWMESSSSLLFDILGNRFILFGEWCYAQHSIKYDKLPDWFLAFDVFDKEERIFLSVGKRNEMIENTSISRIHQIAKGVFSPRDLNNMLFLQSAYGKNRVEGLYLRIDVDNMLLKRAKLVNPDFQQSIDLHWSKRSIIPNSLGEKALY